MLAEGIGVILIPFGFVQLRLVYGCLALMEELDRLWFEDDSHNVALDQSPFGDHQPSRLDIFRALFRCEPSGIRACQIVQAVDAHHNMASSNGCSLLNYRRLCSRSLFSRVSECAFQVYSDETMIDVHRICVTA